MGTKGLSLMSNYILLVNFYDAKHYLRSEELIFTLSENVKNDCISKIIVFNEAKKEPVESDKITYIDTEKRMRFKDFFEYANKHLVGERCILANADMVITEDIQKLDSQCLKALFVCLSRWDQGGKGLEMGGDSQDTWIFDAPLREGFVNNTDFNMGVVFCDNVLAYLAHENGYVPWNPSKDVRTKHVHNSQHRRRPTNPKETVTESGVKLIGFPPMEALKITDGRYMLVPPIHIGEDIKVDVMGSTTTGRS